MGDYITVNKVTTLLLALFFLPNLASAATVPIASGTVRDQNSLPLASMPVECHTANGSFFVSTTSDASGNFTCTGDDATLVPNTTSIVVEVRPPAGYNAENSTNFVWTGSAQTGISLVLISASKTVNITVQDNLGNPVSAEAIVQPINIEPGQSVTQASGSITGGTGSVTASFPDGIVSVDANLSEQNADLYPWMAVGGPQEVHFTDDDSTESVDLTFTVVRSTTKVTVKPVDKDGAILTGNDFTGDVYFEGYNETYGSISTKRKVSSTTGVATVYLLPGIWKVSAIHQQLTNQSFDPAAVTFVLSDEAGTTDWGTIQAQENNGSITGSVKVGDADTNNLTVLATNLDNNQRITAQVANDGTYTISNAALGTYNVTIDSGNFIPTQTAAVELTADQPSATNASITAEEASTTITGNLVDSSGTPVDNFSGMVVVSGDAGEFSAAIEPDGGYTIPMFKNNDGSDATLKLVTQPGADGYATNQAITVADGTVQQNLTLKTDEATITGQMETTAGVEVTNTELGDDAKVMAINTTTGSVEMATVAPDGSFTMDVGPGTWNLVPRLASTNAEVYAPSATNDQVVVTAGDSATSTLEVMTKNATIEGTVTDTSGDPMAEVPVVITNLPALQAAGGTVDPADIISFTATTDSAGVLNVDVPAGDYAMVFGTNPDSATLMAPESVELTASANATADFDAEFREAGKTLSGDVAGNLTSATVTAYSEDGGSTAVDVGKNGEYSLDLPAGTWDVVVSGVKAGELYVQQTSTTVAGDDKTLNLEPSATGVEFPAAVTVSGAADENISLSNTAGASVNLPAFAAAYSGDVTVTLAPVLELAHTGDISQIGLAYEVRVLDGEGIPVSSLNKDATVTLPLDKNLTAGVDTDEVTASYFNDTVGANLFDGMVSDIKDDQMVIQTKHFSRFSAATTGAGALSSPNRVSTKSLKALHIQAHQAQLKWKKPASSTVTRYTLQVRKNGVTKQKQWSSYRATKLTKTIKQLTAQTKYQFRVRACNAVGCGDYSTWKKFTTR